MENVDKVEENRKYSHKKSTKYSSHPSVQIAILLLRSFTCVSGGTETGTPLICSLSRKNQVNLFLCYNLMKLFYKMLLPP